MNHHIRLSDTRVTVNGHDLSGIVTTARAEIRPGLISLQLDVAVDNAEIDGDGTLQINRIAIPEHLEQELYRVLKERADNRRRARGYNCGVLNCGNGQCVHELTDEPCPHCGSPMVRVKTTGFSFCTDTTFCEHEQDPAQRLNTTTEPRP